MNGQLITVDGAEHEIDQATIKELLGSSTRFWLDLSEVDGESATPLLQDTFGFHPLAIEDAEHFGQRPKIDTYDDYVFMVVFGAAKDGTLVEVHCFYNESYLVTAHRTACPALDELRQRLQRGAGRRQDHPIDHVMILYRVIDALIDGYFPVLAGAEQLPGMTPEGERYFRDLYDHLIRISDLVDSYRDLVSSAVDTHLSTVSNRLNVVMKQLAIIATIFLPMS